MYRRIFISSCVLTFAAKGLLVMSLAQAQNQTYPNKPVRIISPYFPGGLGDLVPRAIATTLSESMGQQFLVDNRSGASQAIGMQVAAWVYGDDSTTVPLREPEAA